MFIGTLSKTETENKQLTVICTTQCECEQKECVESSDIHMLYRSNVKALREGNRHWHDYELMVRVMVGGGH